MADKARRTVSRFSVADVALQNVLSRGRYATLDLRAFDGPDRHIELELIRRIRSGMIEPETYPASIRQLADFHVSALSAWENEGGQSRRGARDDPHELKRKDNDF